MIYGLALIGLVLAMYILLPGVIYEPNLTERIVASIEVGGLLVIYLQTFFTISDYVEMRIGGNGTGLSYRRIATFFLLNFILTIILISIFFWKIIVDIPFAESEQVLIPLLIVACIFAPFELSVAILLISGLPLLLYLMSPSIDRNFFTDVLIALIVGLLPFLALILSLSMVKVRGNMFGILLTEKIKELTRGAVCVRCFSKKLKLPSQRDISALARRFVLPGTSEEDIKEGIANLGLTCFTCGGEKVITGVEKVIGVVVEKRRRYAVSGGVLVLNLLKKRRGYQILSGDVDEVWVYHLRNLTKGLEEEELADFYEKLLNQLILKLSERPHQDLRKVKLFLSEEVSQYLRRFPSRAFDEVRVFRLKEEDPAGLL